MPVARRKPVQREKVEQAHIVAFLKGALRGKVYVSGTRRAKPPQGLRLETAEQKRQWYATRQTSGIPDVEAWLPPPPNQTMVGHLILLKVEAKAGRGGASAEQLEYARLCGAGPHGVYHVFGGLNEVLAWAVSLGYVREVDVPHYRRIGGDA